MKKEYLQTLVRLKELANSLPDTRMMSIALIDTLIRLNMQWEKHQLDKNLQEHPFVITNRLVEEAISTLTQWKNISFCDGNLSVDSPSQTMEEEHHDLFQGLWQQYDEAQYLDRIKLYDFRLKINNLHTDFFDGKRVLDMGCGHGNFAHAILNAGGKEVLGIDFGEESVAYALRMRETLGVSPDRLNYIVSTVYQVPEPDASFDFAIQNGVFHHLEDEDAAYREMFRLVKPGGAAWIYTEGENSIARDLFHHSVEMLQDIPAELVNAHLKHLGFSINKRYHLGDSLKAIYKATSWEALTNKLCDIGFSKFQRLTGGMDYDLDVNDEDKWSKEKFAEGDIRLIAYK